MIHDLGIFFRTKRQKGYCKGKRKVIWSQNSQNSMANQLPQNYENLTATDKTDILWNQIQATEYEPGRLPTVVPETWDFNGLTNASFVGVVFNYGDEMPNGRHRMLSAFGSVAKIELEIFANQTGYTGVFKDGGRGLIRLSDQLWSEVGSFNPSLAVKILLDGRPSVNFHAIHKPNVGQGNDLNFFKNPLRTIVNGSGGPVTPTAKSFACSLLLLPGGVNDRPESPGNMPLYEQAEVTAPGGKEVEKVVAPFEITFLPNPAMAWNGSETQDYRLKLALIPAESVLYTVLARRTPNATEHELIGQLVTRSRFVASQYGDEKLAFRHASKRWQPPQDSHAS
ncbi:hypothetical protein BV898_07745 [Hypsibius exemplaris]|uniref:Uncharacterized protein n=1 Tax=Hypsibius exemplaris TaxID=2072580 RepID=A0A1W0WSI3_HYPEX|nr:hypothetical protein BV898_07745 [Hypsibius exemplaris]